MTIGVILLVIVVSCDREGHDGMLGIASLLGVSSNTSKQGHRVDSYNKRKFIPEKSAGVRITYFSQFSGRPSSSVSAPTIGR